MFFFWVIICYRGFFKQKDIRDINVKYRQQEKEMFSLGKPSNMISVPATYLTYKIPNNNDDQLLIATQVQLFLLYISR